MKELNMTVRAKALVDNGFEGNGCGADKFSKLVCNTSNYLLGTDLDEAWLCHDAEYTVEPKFKSREHRKIADSNLYKNMCYLISINESRNWFNLWSKYRFARAVHTLLVLFGSRHYWKV